MITLKDLRTALAECHVQESSIIFKVLRDITNPEYFLLRSMECLECVKQGIDVEKNLVIAIQLLNYRRVLQSKMDIKVQEEKKDFEEIKGTKLRDPDVVETRQGFFQAQPEFSDAVLEREQGIN